jgi:hypothetical protein
MKQNTWLICFFFTGVAYGQIKEIALSDNQGGEIKYQFDTTKISAKVLTKYATLRPDIVDGRYLVGEPLNVCNNERPEYFPCGSRDIDDPNFIKNAEINLRISKESLGKLQEYTEIAILKPFIDYYKQLLTLSIWLNETELEFYKTWDIDVLKRKYSTYDPTKIVPDVISKIEKSKSKHEKYNLVRIEWHIGINHAVQDDFPEDPRDKRWDAFLKEYNIKEDVSGSILSDE